MCNRYARTLLSHFFVGALAIGAVAAQARGDAATVPTAQSVNVEGITFNLPDGWVIRQDARSSGVLLLGVGNGTDYFQIYAKQGGPIDMKATFMNGATLVRDVSRETHGAFSWSVLQSKRSRAGAPDTYVTSFMTTNGGSVIYGYSRSASAAGSQAIVNGFLDQTR